MPDTLHFYNTHASEFIRATVDADVTALYAPFLALLPQGARILDAGCGSGRDSLQFKQRGYRVTAFDGSEEMVRRAAEYSGLPVLHLTFSQVAFVEEFEGIWANASLLHVPLAEMDDVLRRMTRALAPGGIFYLSFKWGEGQKTRGGRLFSDFTEERLRELLQRHPDLQEVRIWKSEDVRPTKQGEFWCNGIVKRR